MKDTDKKPGNAGVSYDLERTFNQRDKIEPLRVLSEDDWSFWQKNGYLIISDAVPKENVKAATDLIWEFEEKDPDDPSTWYRPPRREIEMTELVNSGMVEVYNHQALWDNRQHPKVYHTFVDIWGTEKLWVSIDRMNLNFPVREGYEFEGFIHWDIDTSKNPLPVNVQGVLALSDTDNETGGFQCVPELYRNFDEWVKDQPDDRDPFQPDISGFEIKKVNMNAGDLLIFNSMLPHGIRPNHSDRPRIAQYLSMTPAEEDNEALREWRIKSWRDRIAPRGYAFPGDPRKWEQKHAKTAELTDLGKKLLGLKDW